MTDGRYPSEGCSGLEDVIIDYTHAGQCLAFTHAGRDFTPRNYKPGAVSASNAFYDITSLTCLQIITNMREDDPCMIRNGDNAAVV